MLIKKKPITPSYRHQLLINKSLLEKKAPIKILTKRIKKNSGRNNSGKICIRHRGGGKKKIFRSIFYNKNKNFEAILTGIEYDPNRNAFISRFFNLNKKRFFYDLNIKNLSIGSLIQKKNNLKDINLGSITKIKKLPSGSIISNIQDKNNLIARAAGTYCQLLQKNNNFSKIRLPSGKIIIINSNSIATIGSISNEMHKLQVLGKAGKNRLSGKRPRVRGVAMNPIDHPHGGGGGKPSVSPWGFPTKGKKTKNKKKLK